MSAPNKIYEDFANEAIGRLPEEDKASFDPMTVLLIISLIIGIARLIVACRKNGEDTKNMAEKPSLSERRILKREIRKVLGFKKGLLIGDKFAESILLVGKKYDEEKLQKMLEQANDS